MTDLPYRTLERFEIICGILNLWFKQLDENRRFRMPQMRIFVEMVGWILRING